MSFPATLPSTPVARLASVAPRIAPETTTAPELPRLTRYRGGTYSPTVSTIHFTGGATARTDLVRLNPNIDAYSLDAAGLVSHRPVRYEPRRWNQISTLRARFRAAEITQVIANSYPAVDVVALSERLRAAGYPLGAANLAHHDAIAGTQAAIWKLTNGLELDTRSRHLPQTVRAVAGRHHAEVPVTQTSSYSAVRAEVAAGERLTIDASFAEHCQLAGATFSLAATVPAANLRLRLLKLGADGWSAVTGSELTPATLGGHEIRVAPLATVQGVHRGSPFGYRDYRLEVTASADALVDVRRIGFRLANIATFRNPSPVVYLYQYLLRLADARRHEFALDGPLARVLLAAESGLTPLAVAGAGLR